MKNCENDVSSWSSEKVGKWLPTIGLGDYVNMFLEENVSGELLVDLNSDDLKDLGMSNSFHIKKLLLELRRCKTQPESDNEHAPKKQNRNKTEEFLSVETGLTELREMMFPQFQQTATDDQVMSGSSSSPPAFSEQTAVQHSNETRMQVIEQTTAKLETSSQSEPSPQPRQSRSVHTSSSNNLSDTVEQQTQPIPQQIKKLSEIHVVSKELTVSLLTQPPFKWYWTRGVGDDSYYYVTKYRPDGSRYTPSGVYKNLERNVDYFCTEEEAFDEAIRREGKAKYVKIQKKSSDKK